MVAPAVGAVVVAPAVGAVVVAGSAVVAVVASVAVLSPDLLLSSDTCCTAHVGNTDRRKD